MISLVLYGRNDNYGYNLHKRAAISFNCMAEVLDDKDDEILFVDYNTPDDMPSFVEAILDTLTDRARRLIRVLRVRPALHQRWRGKTHLNALESIARNIAIRRSNPNNRWILSTNTDMVFVLRPGIASLSAAVKDLPRGYYGIPRYEMPESLWESLDRKEPRKIIRSFGQWGRSLHLDEIVHSHKSIIYDGPGDFQLVPRQDMFAIHGFSEAMLRGWHVDSNLAKRCLLLYGETKSLFHRVTGYHCDHTKVVSPLHGHDRQQNDMVEHITNVLAPQIPAQAEDWGVPDEKIEELRFPPGCAVGFAGALAPILGPMTVPQYESTYTEKTWDQVTYVARHALPYLADHLVTLPRDIDIGYAGMNDTLRALLAETWRALGFTGRLLVLDETAGVKPGCEPPPQSDAPYLVADRATLIERAQLFILDIGVEDGPGWTNKLFDPDRNPKAKALLPCLKALQAAGLAITAAERRRMAEGQLPRRIVFVNTIGGDLLGHLNHAVGQTATPYSTHSRHGTVKPDPADTLRQRRADVERLADTLAKEQMERAEGWLPVDLFDQAAPHALLNPAQREAVRAGVTAKRDPSHPWHALAVLSLTTLTDELEQGLDAFLAYSPEAPAQFLTHLAMLLRAQQDILGRPWPPEAAAVIARNAGAFLAHADELPDQIRAHAFIALQGLCRGAAGASLDALADRLVGHGAGIAARIAADGPEQPAWEALDFAAFAQARWVRSDASRTIELVERLLAPALRRVAGDVQAAPTTQARLALIACTPYAAAIDPAAALLDAALVEALAKNLPPSALRVYPIVPPDHGFLAAAQRRGIAVEAGPPNGPGAANLRACVLGMADAIRAWQPGHALAIGGHAKALAVLARGVAPRQALLGAHAPFKTLPGIDAVLGAEDLPSWIGRAASALGRAAA